MRAVSYHSIVHIVYNITTISHRTPVSVRKEGKKTLSDVAGAVLGWPVFLVARFAAECAAVCWR